MAPIAHELRDGASISEKATSMAPGQQLTEPGVGS